MTPAPREGDSPFLPGTCIQFAYDSTSLGWLKRCPRLYQLSMIEGWRPKGQNFHLAFGIYYTEALDAYDKCRANEWDHEDSLRYIVNDALSKTFGWETGDSQKNRYTLLRTIIWHLEQFGEADPARTVIDEEGLPLSERSFRMELDWGPSTKQEVPGLANTYEYVPHAQPYVLCGHLDRVVTFLSGTYVMDHKTTKSTIGDYYFDQYEPNNQMTLYTIAAKVIFSTPVKGVIIDAAQVAVGFSRFARGFTYRTEAQLTEWLKDLHYVLEEGERYATEGYWPMRDTNCFGCQFNHHDGKICAKDPAVREAFLESSYERSEPWNPLKQR